MSHYALVPVRTPLEHQPQPPREQHGIIRSVVLHLMPGALLTAFVVLVAPLLATWGLPTVVGLFLGIGLVIVPVELGVLLLHARRTTGSWNLGQTVLYRRRLPARRLLAWGAALWLWFVVVFMLSTALLDEWLAATFFAWMPDVILQFSNLSGADDGTQVHGAVLLVVIAAVVLLNGFAGPVVEELYFRGYLLPRIERLGRGAPVMNTVLFSIYHFWTPWQNPARIIGFLPITWAAWRSRSIYIAMVTHVAVNLTFLAVLVAAVATA